MSEAQKAPAGIPPSLVQQKQAQMQANTAAQAQAVPTTSVAGDANSGEYHVETKDMKQHLQRGEQATATHLHANSREHQRATDTDSLEQAAHTATDAENIRGARIVRGRAQKNIQRSPEQAGESSTGSDDRSRRRKRDAPEQSYDDNHAHDRRRRRRHRRQHKRRPRSQQKRSKRAGSNESRQSSTSQTQRKHSSDDDASASSDAATGRNASRVRSVVHRVR